MQSHESRLLGSTPDTSAGVGTKVISPPPAFAVVVTVIIPVAGAIVALTMFSVEVGGYQPDRTSLDHLSRSPPQ